MGKEDTTSFTQLATFFIDKFPAAFGAEATYTNRKQETSDETYVRIDLATAVEYDFGEDEERAQSFAKFQKQVLNTFKQESEAASATLLLELLIEQKQNILALPTQIR